MSLVLCSDMMEEIRNAFNSFTKLSNSVSDSKGSRRPLSIRFPVRNQCRKQNMINTPPTCNHYWLATVSRNLSIWSTDLMYNFRHFFNSSSCKRNISKALFNKTSIVGHTNLGRSYLFHAATANNLLRNILRKSLQYCTFPPLLPGPIFSNYSARLAVSNYVQKMQRRVCCPVPKCTLMFVLGFWIKLNSASSTLRKSLYFKVIISQWITFKYNLLKSVKIKKKKIKNRY